MTEDTSVILNEVKDPTDASETVGFFADAQNDKKGVQNDDRDVRNDEDTCVILNEVKDPTGERGTVGFFADAQNDGEGAHNDDWRGRLY